MPLARVLRGVGAAVLDRSGSRWYGQWAKTTQPDDLVTIDWDGQGRVIGVEAIGSAARRAIQALIDAIEGYPARDRDSVRRALDSIIGTSSTRQRHTHAAAAR